jgi:hypothetical protein
MTFTRSLAVSIPGSKLAIPWTRNSSEHHGFSFIGNDGAESVDVSAQLHRVTAARLQA